MIVLTFDSLLRIERMKVLRNCVIMLGTWRIEELRNVLRHVSNLCSFFYFLVFFFYFFLFLKQNN